MRKSNLTGAGPAAGGGNRLAAGQMPAFLLTVDVEDWFQVENLKSRIPFSSWQDCEFRLGRNLERILELLENAPFQIRATFFILGWVARLYPQLVRNISGRGHEIASHGINHQLCWSLNSRKLRDELTESRHLLEDIVGHKVEGFRAPSFAVDDALVKKIQESGYTYDSSYNDFRLHQRYGRIDLSGIPKKGIAYRFSNGFYELPVSNLKAGPISFPLSGGGYFRMFPYAFYRRGISHILSRQQAYVFYLHPWEIDNGQPRIHHIKPTHRLRHYSNLKTTYSKLRRLLQDFRHCRFISCTEYLSNTNGHSS